MFYRISTRNDGSRRERLPFVSLFIEYRKCHRTRRLKMTKKASFLAKNAKNNLDRFFNCRTRLEQNTFRTHTHTLMQERSSRRSGMFFFNHQLFQELTKTSIHHIGTLRQRRIDWIELSTVVEDLIHIANEITHSAELMIQHFASQCAQI